MVPHKKSEFTTNHHQPTMADVPADASINSADFSDKAESISIGNDAELGNHLIALASASASAASTPAATSKAAAAPSPSPSTTTPNKKKIIVKKISPVVIIQDYQDDDAIDAENPSKKKKSKPNKNPTPKKSKNKQHNDCGILRPESSRLLSDMLYPLNPNQFLHKYFRKDAVCIQRRPRSLQQQPLKRKARKNEDDGEDNGNDKNANHHDNTEGTTNTSSNELETMKTDDANYGNKAMVSHICHEHLFDLDIRQIFAETSSENVFLWLRPPPADPSSSSATSASATKSATPPSLNSVEISDPDTAYSLHRSGSHPAYCRAPPPLEQLLVGNLLRATGLGGGHYHPPHAETATLGGNTTMGRGEVELFIGVPGTSDVRKKSPSSNGKRSVKKHTTGWHTDFQENFTIQLSGIKKWTLRRGRVRHPLRGTTPHYCREASVVENQLKMARMCCAEDASQTKYGFEYGENNAYGEEETVVLYPGDVLYFPSGMWHKVETIQAGVSLNVSLMGTTWASLVCDSLQQVLMGGDERWREVVTFRPPSMGTLRGGADDGVHRLQQLLGGLPKILHDFTTRGGGARSLMPPALCYPQWGSKEEKEEFTTVGADGESLEEGSESEEEEEVEEEDGSMDEEMEIDNDGAESEDEGSMWGIVVSMDDFQGPPGWSCDMLSKAMPVRNPLASLIAMSEVEACVSNDESHHERTPKSGKQAKKYILNVNFAGNDMCESHVRVVLETTDHIDLMNWYIACEARGDEPGHIFCQMNGLKKPVVSGANNAEDNDCKTSFTSISKNRLAGSIPPPALFFYGYFSWNVSVEGPTETSFDQVKMGGGPVLPPIQNNTPAGEIDETRTFKTFQQARDFVDRYARKEGFIMAWHSKAALTPDEATKFFGATRQQSIPCRGKFLCSRKSNHRYKGDTCPFTIGIKFCKKTCVYLITRSILEHSHVLSPDIYEE